MPHLDNKKLSQATVISDNTHNDAYRDIQTFVHALYMHVYEYACLQNSLIIPDFGK